MGRQTRKWSSKMHKLTQCCRAFTLALARLSCYLKSVKCVVCQCFKLCILSLLMQVCVTVMISLLPYRYYVSRKVECDWYFCFWPMCVYISEAWHTGVTYWRCKQHQSKKLSAFVSDRPKLSVGTMLTSRQIRWSPNFSRTIDSDTIGKWGRGQRSSLAPLHRNLGWGHSPPAP